MFHTTNSTYLLLLAFIYTANIASMNTKLPSGGSYTLETANKVLVFSKNREALILQKLCTCGFATNDITEPKYAVCQCSTQVRTVRNTGETVVIPPNLCHIYYPELTLCRKKNSGFWRVHDPSHKDDEKKIKKEKPKPAAKPMRKKLSTARKLKQKKVMHGRTRKTAWRLKRGSGISN